MKGEPDLEALAEACLVANEAVSKYGTSEMQTLMRVLLVMVGQELAAARESEGDRDDFKAKAARTLLS